MMFGLAFDIFFSRALLRLPDGEGSVSLLPGKLFQPECLMDPSGRIGLDLLDGLGWREGGGNGKEKVGVVDEAADHQRHDAALAGKAAKVGPESFTDFRSEERFPLFGGEDDVVETVGVGVGHGIDPSGLLII